MDDKNPVNPDTSNPDGGSGNTDQKDTQNPAGGQPDTVEGLKEANAKLFARATKAEEALKKAKEPAPVTPAPAPQPAPASSTGDEIDVVLGLRNQGYSDAEILELRGMSKKYNRPLSDLMSDELIKSGIEAKREKTRVANATPKPTNRGTGGLPPGKKLSDLPPEQRGFQGWKARTGGSQQG